MPASARSIAVIGLTHNLQDDVAYTLTRIQETLYQHPEFHWHLFFVDAGSRDRTWEQLQESTSRMDTLTSLHRQENFSGGAALLQASYQWVLRQRQKLTGFSADWIMKLDLRSHIDQQTALQRAVALLEQDPTVSTAVGVQRRSLDPALREYEHQRRQALLAKLEQACGQQARSLDPSSIGFQLYRSEVLQTLLEDERNQQIETLSAQDLLLPLLALKSESGLHPIKLPESSHPHPYRPDAELEEIYDQWEQVLALSCEVSVT